MARAVLLRILQIALGLSFFLMAGLYLGRSFVPRVFTADPAVIAIAERVFPILAAFIVSTLKSVWRHLMIPLQVRRVCWLDPRDDSPCHAYYAHAPQHSHRQVDFDKSKHTSLPYLC